MRRNATETGQFLSIVTGCILLMFLSVTQIARADLLDSMELALMPGELSKAHAKFEETCTECHKFFKQSFQNDLCLDCHDHKNIVSDIKNKTGFHGRIPDVNTKECKVCHQEHRGRETSIILLDQQTFDHAATDFQLRGSHLVVACQGCHKPKKKYYEAKQKCIDCHKDDEPHKGKLGKVCNSCHRETSWNDFQYDHSKTDFPLKGKHKGVDCRDCHPQERYLSVPTKCYSCHQNDDNHEGRFGKKCKSCHKTAGWAEKHFDHDKDTKFKLTGKHNTVSCNQCHKKDEDPYDKKRERTCFSCHKFTDEHKGQYGKKCKDCHNTKGWRKNSFDHDKTDFRLTGKHEDVTCGDCHPGNLFKDKVSSKCYDCHRQHDIHDGQQGKKCHECHSEKGWLKEVHFDHDITRFPLLGSHATLACEECHSTGVFKDAKHNCISCHTEDDIHKKRLGKQCGLCHNSTDWKTWNFDHDKQTDFKLRGAHKGIDCLSCHQGEMADEVNILSTCYSCHLADDKHDGGFGRVCDRCHNEESFGKVTLQ